MDVEIAPREAFGDHRILVARISIKDNVHIKDNKIRRLKEWKIKNSEEIGKY